MHGASRSTGHCGRSWSKERKGICESGEIRADLASGERPRVARRTDAQGRRATRGTDVSWSASRCADGLLEAAARIAISRSKSLTDDLESFQNVKEK